MHARISATVCGREACQRYRTLSIRGVLRPLKRPQDDSLNDDVIKPVALSRCYTPAPEDLPCDGCALLAAFSSSLSLQPRKRPRPPSPKSAPSPHSSPSIAATTSSASTTPSPCSSARRRPS